MSIRPETLVGKCMTNNLWSIIKMTKIYGWQIGFNPYKMYGFFRNLPAFWREYKNLRKQAEDSPYKFPVSSIEPYLFDKHQSGGVASGHYFHQDLLVASKIYQANPDRHIDVGSRIDGFVAHVASFRKIEVADIRELQSYSENICYFQLDIMNELPEEYIECTDSLSCLHVIEHLGLGRYGDPLQWDGHIVGLKNLSKMLKKDGKFYFSTPIGPQRIVFNAHRIFSLQTLLDFLSEDFLIEDFAYVDDSGNLNKDVELNKEKINNNLGCKYGCAIFELRKK